MQKKRYTFPFVLPVAAFALTILTGSLLLWWDTSAAGAPVAFVDAFFIATSAVCVTGLASVDISQAFNGFGHTVILCLIQLGGLGITTYTTLILYLWSRRISLSDRMAVGQTLLRNPSFNLGKFLSRMVITILVLEACGALTLYFSEPDRIGLFHSVFLAVSAFCNAGFALWPDSLIGWQQSPLINIVIMLLIVCGGLGFAVLDECIYLGREYALRWRRRSIPPQKAILYARGSAHPQLKLSLHSRIVLSTTLVLILAGAALIMLPEFFANDEDLSTLPELVWPALFQSVTSRTAGFCSMDIATLTDVSLLVIIFLMFIGGSPGSCAGGIKTTSFRVLLGFLRSQLQGRQQVLVHGKGMDRHTISKMFTLLTFSVLTISFATFALVYAEGGARPHGKTPFQVLDLLFEAVSAFATVGLSTNVTPQLSTAGKLIDCMLMFMGRLGPIWLITTLQQFHTDPAYRLPEVEVPIG